MFCPCGIDTPNPVYIGVQEGCGTVSDMVLWNCRLGSTHAIPWLKTTYEQREAANLAEDAMRPKSPETMW